MILRIIICVSHIIKEVEHLAGYFYIDLGDHTSVKIRGRVYLLYCPQYNS